MSISDRPNISLYKYDAEVITDYIHIHMYILGVHIYVITFIYINYLTTLLFVIIYLGKMIRIYIDIVWLCMQFSVELKFEYFLHFLIIVIYIHTYICTYKHEMRKANKNFEEYLWSAILLSIGRWYTVIYSCGGYVFIVYTMQEYAAWNYDSC